MNINFFIQPEKGTVVVSDEHGNMTFREYQDNIKDVLFLEDIVEGLEKDYSELNEDKEKNNANITDIEKRMEEAPIWQKRANKLDFLKGIGMFSLATFLGYAAKVPDLKLNVLEQLQNTDVLNSTLNAAGIGLLGNGCLFGCIYKLRKEDREEKQAELETAEIEQKDLKLKLFFTKHILFEYKNRLIELFGN